MVKKIKIASIDTESGTQTRIALQEDVITDYAEAMKGRVKFPPVVVFHDGNVHYLADGFHRVMAAVRNGAKEIEADVKKGSCLDALKYALGANTDHGLRRTNADKRKCVTLALASFGKLSDRGIADMCGVSHPTVAEARQVANSSTSTPAKRQGKDGKTYPAKQPVKDEQPDAGEGEKEKEEMEMGNLTAQRERLCEGNLPSRLLAAIGALRVEIEILNERGWHNVSKDSAKKEIEAITKII